MKSAVVAVLEPTGEISFSLLQKKFCTPGAAARARLL
jgi:hypothetical protein